MISRLDLLVLSFLYAIATTLGIQATETAVYVSGTMHIESAPQNWPDCTKLIDFFKRATTAGMHWSVGADIGWLKSEPRAAEVIKTTEALGVQWDVHAHYMSDRATCAAYITRYGGHPTQVVSGLVNTEIDALRTPLKSSLGTTWTPAVLWGIVTSTGHTLGADDLATGDWRPKSSTAYTTDDPAGNLIAIGGGSRKLADAESFAKAPNITAPVTSTSIMVAPKTLTVLGGTDGIDAIEAWVGRMKQNSSVRWATISETAVAWKAAGSVPSRQGTAPTTSGLSAKTLGVMPGSGAKVIAPR